MDELQQALFDAIGANDLEAVKRCVEQGAYLGRWSRCECCDETPLHVAINAKDNVDKTALDIAKHHKIREILITAGAKNGR